MPRPKKSSRRHSWRSFDPSSAIAGSRRSSRGSMASRRTRPTTAFADRRARPSASSRCISHPAERCASTAGWRTTPSCTRTSRSTRSSCSTTSATCGASLGVGTPGEQLDLHRFQDQLTQRLDGLADWQAEIFEMRHFENLSIPEISERTQRSSDAVRSSLYRVKRIFLEAAQANGLSTAFAGDQA